MVFAHPVQALALALAPAHGWAFQAWSPDRAFQDVRGNVMTLIGKRWVLEPPECRDPHFAEQWLPMEEVLQKAGTADGFCHFGWGSARAAQKARDYVVCAFTEGPTRLPTEEGGFVDLLGPYEADEFRAARGVWAYDAKLGYDNGFLDIPEAALWNATMLEEIAQRRCEEFHLAPGHESLTFMGMINRTFEEYAVMMAEAKLPFASRPLKMPTKLDTFRHELTWKCIMGWHGLACDMAHLRYHYCKLPGGLVGMGNQCRKDWMDEAFVEHTVAKVRSAAGL